MAPVAGSAYTYAYTTMGELLAWIIGWDLVLEYAVGASAVSTAWSGYFQKILLNMGIVIPVALSGSPYKYDHGFYLPNVQATLDGETVTQHAIAADGGANEGKRPDYRVHWVRKKDNSPVGMVGDQAVESKLTNLQQAYINLPAVIIVAIVTGILVKGISESAGF